MTSKVIWIAIFTGLIEIIQHHKLISHCPCRRRSIGPLPSCLRFARLNLQIIFEHLEARSYLSSAELVQYYMHLFYICTKKEVFEGKEVREARAHGGGKLARRRNKKELYFMDCLTHKSTLLSIHLSHADTKNRGLLQKKVRFPGVGTFHWFAMLLEPHDLA